MSRASGGLRRGKGRPLRGPSDGGRRISLYRRAERRDQVGLLLVVTSGLFSVLLAVAVNVATGGRLPDPLTPYAWLSWPVVAALAMVGVALALWQHRLSAVVATAPVASVPRELPGAPALFGLEEDLRTVGRALDAGAQVVVLAAAPGSGKTSLALRVAHDARHRFPDGQLYAVLRGASADPVPPEVVLARFLGALGRPEDERRGTVDELGARFRSAVAERKVLVLLDDARDAAQVEPLLAGGAGCLTVITSRRLLAGLPGAPPRTRVRCSASAPPPPGAGSTSRPSRQRSTG